MRGLEPFQNRTTHEDMHSKRKIHKSTIIIEQVRQAMLGIKDPERFRFLVAPQSDLALRRAQELAAMDEFEVYPQRQMNKDRNIRRSTMSLLSSSSSSSSGDGPSLDIQQHHRRLISHDSINIFSTQRHNGTSAGLIRSVASTSSLMPSMDLQQRNNSNHRGQDVKGNCHNQSFGSTSSTPSLSSLMNPSVTASSLFSSNIRRLQEQNARRLMEIYNQPCGPSSSQPSPSSSLCDMEGGGNNGSNLFRFSLRRDSLLGSTTTGMNVNNTWGHHQHHPNSNGLDIDSAHLNGVQINSSDHHQQHLLRQLQQQQQQQNQHDQQQHSNNMASMVEMMPLATRFHIRRDSLSHLSQY